VVAVEIGDDEASSPDSGTSPGMAKKMSAATNKDPRRNDVVRQGFEVIAVRIRSSTGVSR
jgi:hypothetical protein